ncbi:MAG: hypothetical protein KJZ59_00360 [Pararhodobacter sp.]|nr:hypothetical protein [Pararhodobacter sp.]
MAIGPHKLFVLKTVLRGRMGIIFRVALLGLVISLAAGFVWSASYSKTRVVLLDVQTRSLTLKSLGQGVAWHLPGATVCRPRSEGFDPEQPVGDGPCDGRRFETAVAQDITIDMWAGLEARISVSADGLVIRASSRFSEDLPEGTRISVPVANWQAMGALTFAAELTVGEPLRSGTTAQLLSGRWEMRQSGWAIAPGRSDVTEVVKEGRVTPGAVVQVWESCPAVSGQRGCGPRAPAVLYGHLLPVDAGDTDQINVVAISAPGLTELTIGNFGATAPSTIRPSLLDIAITSPLLLAMAFLLSIIVSLTQVFSILYRAIGDRNEPRTRH